MKFLATILCIYMLYVAAMTCCGDGGMIVFGSQIEQQSADMDGHSACSDMCSPFCLCSTCGGFTMAPLVANIQSVAQNFSDASAVYLSSTYHSPSLKGVWQPPKY
jgi:hypothetical protein